MRGEFIAPFFLPDEGADLHILAHHLLGARPVAEDEIVEVRLVQRPLSGRVEDGGLYLVAPAQPQRLHQAVIGDLRGVGDEPDDRVLQVAVDGGEHLVGQPGPERLALPVDVKVVAPGKIDALKGTGRARQGLREGGGGHRAALLDHDDMAGRHLADRRRLEVEHGHERSALRGNRDHLVILEIITRSDARGIAHDKRVAVADETSQRVAAVQARGGAGDDAGDVEILTDAPRNLGAGQAARAQKAEDVLVLFVEEKTDLFQDRLRVGGKDGMLPHRDEAVVQLHRVGHVEIPRQHQVPRRPWTAPEIGMAGAETIAARRAVAQVPEVEFRAEIKALLDRFRELRMNCPVGDLRLVLLQQLPENSVERIGLDVALAEHERLARRHVELNAGGARAVLAAVVLFLHQQE